MRGIVTFIFVFGAVGIAYAIHLSRRAVATVQDASTLLKQTGSISDTVQQLLLERNLPDAMRISPTQRAYVVTHQAEFERIYGAAIEAQAKDEFLKWHRRNPNASKLAIEGGVQAASFLAAIQHARMFCEMRQVS